MRQLYYRDWSEKEINTAVEMLKARRTYKAISDAVGRPYGQTRSMAAVYERRQYLGHEGIIPMDYKVVDKLRILGGKLEKIESAYSATCDEAVIYLTELHNEIYEINKSIFEENKRIFTQK